MPQVPSSRLSTLCGSWLTLSTVTGSEAGKICFESEDEAVTCDLRDGAFNGGMEDIIANFLSSQIILMSK